MQTLHMIHSRVLSLCRVWGYFTFSTCPEDRYILRGSVSHFDGNVTDLNEEFWEKYGVDLDISGLKKTTVVEGEQWQRHLVRKGRETRPLNTKEKAEFFRLCRPVTTIHRVIHRTIYTKETIHIFLKVCRNLLVDLFWTQFTLKVCNTDHQSVLHTLTPLCLVKGL